MGFCGFIIFLFLVPSPEILGYTPPGPLRYRKMYVAGSSDEGSCESEEAQNSGEEVSIKC